MKAFCITACIFIFCQCKSDRLILGKAYAEKELKATLTDTTKYDYTETQTSIIKDSVEATTYAESILFKIYGKQKIIDERPYEIYHLGNYWLLTGTLPVGWSGGTFLIIIDGRNSEVLNIKHGK